MTIRQKLVLLTFVIGMVIVVVGLVKNGWYMNELSMCFLGMGILMGIFGGMNETEIAEEFINGVKDIAFAAMVIGFCSGIMVIAQDGMIIDTILNALSGLVEKSNNVVFSAVDVCGSVFTDIVSTVLLRTGSIIYANHGTFM